ncbi:MAG: thiolase family protein [Bacteroidota bacterium]|nr:thiolase family protein [Bacteroidota bacterium]MDP4233219.1 thiolase family protein [Bacteroidota bacterium]MDP4242162.1 thiolase family protein [Bacteroidota bacterium]MDP4287812.1 thiolase family protein [Bacteroidota bacterium]
MKSFHHSERGIGITFDDIVLLGGARTPFGDLGGSLSRISPTDLGIIASRGALERTGTSPADVDQAIIANIGQASYDAYFVARHIALYAGLPIGVPALQVQRICASGIETMVTGAEQIMLGKADTVLCCGAESMSLAPTASFGNRMGYHLGQVVFKDMLWEALDDTAAGFSMGQTGENVAEKYGILRADTDAFGKCSQDRAAKAQERGYFAPEITEVQSTTFAVEGLQPRAIRVGKKGSIVSKDEHIRATTAEALAGLPTSFRKDGVQTAGNSAAIVDGASAVIISSGSKAASRNGSKPLARLVAAATCGVDPKYMGIGPVPAIQLLLELAGLTVSDIGLFEINEAFAAQVIACERVLGLDHEKVNVNGGAVALGHPLAATGTRLALTVARSLQERNVRFGIATACIGGGQGTAMLLENLN